MFGRVFLVFVNDRRSSRVFAVPIGICDRGRVCRLFRMELEDVENLLRLTWQRLGEKLAPHSPVLRLIFPSVRR